MIRLSALVALLWLAACGNPGTQADAAGSGDANGASAETAATRPDITARYENIEAGKPTTVIKVRGNGDWRFDALGEDGAPALTLVSKGGVSYAIVTDRSGTFAARTEDLGTALREIGNHPDPADGPAFTLTRGAEITVDGYSGTTWFLSPEGSDDEKSYVISTDPALAPLAQVWLAYAKMTSALNLSSAKEAEQLETLFKTGAPIVMLDVEHLKEVKTGPVSEADFALPQTMLDTAAIRARLAAQRGE